MKNITHYFQTSPNSTFRPSISPPKEVKNTPNETSSTALSKSGVASESESSSPTLKTYKRHESRSNSSCEIIDSEETKSPSMVRNTGSCSQKSKKKPDNKINGSVVGIEAGISEAKMKDSKRHSKGSDQAVDVVESDDETLQSEEVVSPNAFQILMSTQQVFSSSNSGKKECFEEADDASSKKERKRIMKENLEQMSKRKLNMETSMKANGVDKPARKRRRIVKESDLEDNDDDPMETPVLNKSSDNNLNENIRRKKMPELDIVFKKELNRSKTPCGKGKGSVGDKKNHEDLIKSNKSSDSALTESGTITFSKLAKKETSVKLNVNSNTNTENVQDLSEDENIITFSPLNKTKGGKILNTPFNKVKGKQNKVSTELKECKSEDVRNPQILKENGKAWKIGPPNNTDIENNQLDLTLADEESEVSVDKYEKNDEKAVEAITENKTVKRKCTAKLKEKLSTKKRKVKGGEFLEKNDAANSNPEEKAVVVNNANALVSEDCYENNEIEILIDSENTSIVSKAEIAASDTQTPSTSDKRKSNLLNYFNKVSSEDRNRHSDKFEVKVDVHFPVVGKPSQREVGKSAKKTINGNKTKKKGKNEIEDDIQLVDSELIDKPLGNSVNSSKLSSDNSLTSVSVENADSDLKENMSSTPTISSEKSFLSSGWRMRICMSDVSGSASKKPLKKNNSISKCKKLKLCNGNVGGKEKEVTCFDSDDICGESKSETTTSLNDSQNITSEREVTKSESSSVNDDVCNISINIEDSKTLESSAKIVSASNKISQSSKQKKLTTKENEQIGGTSGLKQKLIFAVKPKTNEEENDYCEDTPVVIDKGEENRSNKQKGILMFTRKLGAKEVVENNSGGISFVNSLKKQGVNKTSPSNRTSGLKKSMSSKKTVANNKKSGKDVTDSSSVKKSTPKKAIVVEEEVTPSRKLTRSKQNSRTPKNKPAFSENSTFSDQNKICGDGVGSQNVTPSKTSANVSQGDSSPKSMSAKKVFNKKVNQCSRVKNLLSEKNVSPRGARMSADVAEQEKPEVVETPIRSRRSCTLTPSAGSQYVEISDSEDSAKEEKATKVIKKRTTPLKNRNAKMLRESPAEGKKIPPSNLNTKRLRLKLRRFSSVTGSESSDSWRSVSPESVVNLTDNDEEEEEEEETDDDDEPIILKKKSKKSEDKISDDDILKLIAERKVVMQAIKRTRGKLTKLFSAEEKSCTQTLSADKSEKQGSQKPANIRLAPVFMKQNSKRLDKASLQAKKIFLQSGVPEVVKKMIEVQKLAEELAEEHMLFPAISHVQQREENGRMWKLEKMLHKFPQCIGDEDVIKTCNIPVGVFTSCKELENKDKKMLNPSRPNRINVFRDFLRSIKAESPDFPVYRSFRNLYVQNRPLPNESSMAKKKRRSRGSLKKGQPEDKKVEISQASWSSKYRPVSSENIVGNRQSIKKLKHWLELWVQVMEGKVFQKSAKSDANSDDDFINDGSDDEKKCSLLKNTVVITGPNGCGKTMAVFTLARELGYKVLEVNAASKRTGRRILSELLEATQSHQVHSKGDESNSGIKNFFAAKHKPVAKKPKEKEKELQGNKLSLILVEDVDVVFEEQDEGFVSALSTLMSVSKRPIVLVSSNPSCAHLGRLMEKSLALEFKTVSSKLLGAWLQIICLLEGVRVKRLTMEELLFQNGGDVRKTLMQLQFWVLSGGNVCNEILDSCCKSENAIDLEDDSSNSSWVSMVDDKKANEGNHPFHSGCVERLLEQESGVIPVSRGKLWWNIPRVLGWSSSTRITTFNLCGTKTNKLVETTDFESTDIKSIDEVDNKSVTSESEIESVSNTKTDSADVLPGKDLKPEKNFVKNWKSVCSIEDVNALLRLTEVLSIVESFRIGSVENFFEPERCLWEQDVKDSLSLSEDMRPVWCGAETVSSSISSWLVRESVVQCAKVLQPNQNCSVLSDLQRNISEDELRWRENQHSASLELSEAVPMLYWPERRTLSIDYLSSLRNISRLEQDRSYINGKRNNRFFHYLKGLGVDPVSSVLDAACSAFQSNSKS